MYVAPTPFALLNGTAHHRTLVVPSATPVDGLIRVGDITRCEADRIAVAYDFDLRTNELNMTLVPNPHAGREHDFTAYRLQGEPATPVILSPRDV